MGKFFLKNREIRECLYTLNSEYRLSISEMDCECFDALPVEVRNKIIESDLKINSKDELELVAKRLENLSK